MILFLAAGLVAILWIVLPREQVVWPAPFDPSVIGDDVDAWLEAQERAIDGIVSGTEKRVIWAEDRGERTGISVLYLHGYSATSEEIRPVPDRVAEALGANLVFWRLTGHGRDGPAMAEATAGDWIADLDQALATAARVGEKVLVIGTSTGGTLAALAAADDRLGRSMAGIVFVSPNFGVRAGASNILTWPGVRLWGPLVAGRTRSFEPVNDGHRAFWTTRYPTVALIPMALVVQAAVRTDYADVEIPALFMFSPEDRVVLPSMTRKIADRWGGPVATREVTLADGSDPYNHVIAGDILSPPMTGPVVDDILGWVSSTDLQSYAKNP